jgi:cellulose synthase/poly-beta-1,6-N-acetylglucosamine synthase-like glycosyltransferase
MLTFLSIVITALALLLLIPTLVFFLEVAAGCLLPMQRVRIPASEQRNGHVAVLIPAHNEAAGIRPTIDDVKKQLRPGDRLVVVADNCTDETAAAAAASGAEVSIRNDPTKIGKGYALDWGIKYLTSAPPDILIVIDADCRVAEGAIENLARECCASEQPVQALYLMTAAAGSSINQQVAQFAWRVKNLVRPLGLRKLSLPCQLMGSGMAFPWKLIHSTDLYSGLIVEDMKLGLDLAAQGKPPIFCPSAFVSSTFPTSGEGTRAQRQRWEQGHMSLILGASPRLLRVALRKCDIKLFAIALDVAIPPLSFLVLLLAASVLGTAVATILGLSPYPFFVCAICLTLAATATLLAWTKHGRDILPLRAIVLIVPYLFRKLSLYGQLAIGRRASRWIRTDRS